jgi:hypothetical protein
VRALEQDANAAAILVHVYTFGYETTAKLLRESGSSSYRELATRYPDDLGVKRRWPDRVLETARRFGYTQILPAGTLVPPSATPRPTPPIPPGAPGAKTSSPWFFVAAIAAGGGLLYLATKKKARA